MLEAHLTACDFCGTKATVTVIEEGAQIHYCPRCLALDEEHAEASVLLATLDKLRCDNRPN